MSLGVQSMVTKVFEHLSSYLIFVSILLGRPLGEHRNEVVRNLLSVKELFSHFEVGQTLLESSSCIS